MHESPVARELVRAALDSSGTARRITAMEIRLGPEGAYAPESLKTHIHAMAVGTVAKDAVITIIPVLSGGAELVKIDVEEEEG